MRAYILPDPLIEFGLANLPVVYAIFFVGFFMFVAVALWGNDRPTVRKGFILSLICILLFFNIFNPYILPIIDFHKFSEAPGESKTFHEIRVTEGEADQELKYDSMAVPPKLHTHMGPLGEEIATNMTHREQEMMSQYLLERANAYRETFPRKTTIGDVLQFPYHANEKHWAAEEVPDEDFDTLRVYRVTLEMKSDSNNIINYTEERVYEYQY